MKIELHNITTIMKNTNLHFSKRTYFATKEENCDKLIVIYFGSFSKIASNFLDNEKRKLKVCHKQIVLRKTPKNTKFMKYVGSFLKKYCPRNSEARILLFIATNS